MFGLIYMYFSKLCQVSDQGHYSPGLRSLRHSDIVLEGVGGINKVGGIRGIN